MKLAVPSDKIHLIICLDWGVGKLTSPLSANANALPVTFCSPSAGNTLMS